jgi:Big-like domain-containing protein
MTRYTIRWLLALCLLLPLRPASAAQNDSGELYRIRIMNQVGGPVEVSADRGGLWEQVGKVTRAAVAAAIASNVITAAPTSTVAGVTPEQVLIRLPASKGQPRSLRILATGETANNASIATDIPSRGALFRYFAPPIGSQVTLDRDGGAEPLPADYLPRLGDRLLIRVSEPAAGDPPTLTIENKVGGEVVLMATGGIPQVLARVKQPVRGIGRYAGTERCASGSVLSWSPTAVLVSTAGRVRKVDGDGQPVEERGGFVIQPAEPALQGGTHPASQLLLEALPEGQTRPVVSSFFVLPAPLSTGDPLDSRPTRVEVRIDNGEWEPLPDLRGPMDEADTVKALRQALGGGESIKLGITHIRFLFGALDEDRFERLVRLAITPESEKVQRGRATISARVMGEGITYVTFYLDGALAKVTNKQPFVWEWDTTRVANGEHLIEIRGLDQNGATVTSALSKVIVDN